MMDLKDIKSQKHSAPPRVIVYGPVGVGKSTLGTLAPSPIFFDIEGGLNGIECKSVKINSIREFTEWAGKLATEEHDFKTLVIDSLDWLEKLSHQDVCAQHGVENIENIGYGKGYVFAASIIADLCRRLDEKLRTKRGMMILFTAHNQVKTFSDPMHDSYDRHQLKLHSKAADHIMEWCDAIFFINKKPVLKKTDAGFGKKETKAVSDELVIYTTPRPSFVAKHRAMFNVPDEIPYDRESNPWKTIFSKGEK